MLPRKFSDAIPVRFGSAQLARIAMLAASVLLAGGIAAGEAAAEKPQLTFFAWSDQHVQVDGDGEHLVPAIDAMNQLPGTAYPESSGGKAAQPSFVFGCGDITEWPTHAAMTTYDQLLTQRLKFPAYDVIGNHDEGGKEPSDTIKDWLKERHGGLTYCWKAGGVRFIALYSPYDESLNSPAQPLTEEALERLGQELAKADKSTPTIVATHLCYDAITNRDDLIEVLKPYRILAVLGGHYHKAKVDHYGGVAFVQIPSPAPGSPSEVMVVRVTPERILALPYDYEQESWATESRKVLDQAWSERSER